MKLNAKAFYLAEAGAQYSYSTLMDKNGSLSEGNFFANVNLKSCNNTGIFEKCMYSLESKGLYKDATKEISLKLTKIEPPNPNMDAAMGIYANDVNATIDAETSGNVSVMGYDNYPPEDFNCLGSCYPYNSTGWEVTNSIYLSDPDTNIKRKGNPDLYPDPDEWTYDENKEFYTYTDWKDFAENIENENIGNTFDENDDSVYLGTRDDPQITILESGFSLTGGVSGAGVLIVKGDAHFGGNFHYEGIVIVLKEEGKDIDFFSAGTPNVFGSVIVAGENNIDVSLLGTADIYYSSKAIQNISNIKNLKKIVAWSD
jgi:hypothetical protein